jgi:hypothetical protein
MFYLKDIIHKGTHKESRRGKEFTDLGEECASVCV